jgi:hypothetical protein
MTYSTQWDVPYLFNGATIIHDTSSWTGGERLAELLHHKLLSFRLGKRQNSLFGSLDLFFRYSMSADDLFINSIPLFVC